MSTSLRSALAWRAKTSGQRVTIIVGNDEVSYRELQDWTCGAARYLNQRGDRIGVLGGNTLESCVAALGVVKAGAVLIAVNERLVAAELQKIIYGAGISTVLVDTGFDETVDHLEAAGPAVTTIEFEVPASSRNAAQDDYAVEVRADEPTMVLFNSGTTGRSKGVTCTNKTLLSSTFEACLTEEGVRPRNRTLLTKELAENKVPRSEVFSESPIPGMSNGRLDKYESPEEYGGLAIKSQSPVVASMARESTVTAKYGWRCNRQQLSSAADVVLTSSVLWWWEDCSDN